jgi:hypothetical protein
MAPRRFFTSPEKRAPRRAADRGTRVDVGPSRLQIVKTDRPLLDTEGVRKRLGLGSINAVYRLVALGLPRLELSAGLYRFDQDVLDAWIAARQQRQSELPPLAIVHGR